MKAVLHMNQLQHQAIHGLAMAEGLRRHGILVEFGAWNDPEPCSFAVMWGWKQPAVVARAPHVLVMEAGCMSGPGIDRLTFISCGWDGLGGRATYAKGSDMGLRWSLRFGHLMQPQRESKGGYALLIGQVEGDAALATLPYSFNAWAQGWTRALLDRGYRVVYRPHPVTVTYGGGAWRPVGSDPSRGSLFQDLAGAALCVTYNSSAAVAAVLEGVATIAMDEGSMAWPVTNHELGDPRHYDRTAWAHDLAWTSYTIDELRSGFAWERLSSFLAGDLTCSSR